MGRPKNCKRCKRPKKTQCICGRPTVFTPEVIAKLEEAFSWGCSDLEACYYADISQRVLYDYQQKNEGFLRRKERLKSRPVLGARQTVLKGVIGQKAVVSPEGHIIKAEVPADPDLALRFLERIKKDEFSTKSEVGLSGTIGIIDAELMSLDAEEREQKKPG